MFFNYLYYYLIILLVASDGARAFRAILSCIKEIYVFRTFQAYLDNIRLINLQLPIIYDAKDLSFTLWSGARKTERDKG